MVVRVRVGLISQTVRVAMERGLSAEAMSERLARVARRKAAEAAARNAAVMGRAVLYETVVDGVKGASEDAVKPDGVILHEFAGALWIEALRWMHEQIQAAAPVKSGRYRENIRIYADGAEVATVEAAAAATDVIFASTVAYARKIEGSKIPGYPKSPLSAQAPDGVFHAVAFLAAGRFGNAAAIKFTLADPEGGSNHLEQWAAGKSGARFYRGTKKRRRNLSRQGTRDRRVPAIIVRRR